MTRPATRLVCCLLAIQLLLVGAILSRSAAAEPGEPLTRSGALQEEQPEKNNSIYNDLARFIAGLPTAGSGLASYENKPAWIKYSESMQRSWDRFGRTQLRPMQEWAARELGAAITAAVFYPFSGPDFVNVYTLFPHATTYLLVALESVGVLPDFSALDTQDFFASLQRSLYDYLYIDYFGTAKMAAQIGRTKLKGVLPVLLFFLAREQTRVLDIRYLVLKADGSTTEQPAAAGGADVGKGIAGVRLVFKGARTSGTQTLYYFRCDLGDGSFGRRPQFAAFLKRFGPLTTFTKSASYLLASPYSSHLRQFVLEQSRYVVQDDSGIPLRDFAPATWTLKFFGTYTVPIAPFQYRYQKDLAQAYARGDDVYPLPFGIGYHFRPGTSNLLIAAKR
jgi:hypothetical protein